MVRFRINVFSFMVACVLLLIVTACVPAKKYEPLQLTNLDLNQSRTLALYANAGWRDTGIRISHGEVYRVNTSGTWSMSAFCGPTGSEGLAIEHLTCMKGIFAQSFPLPEGRIGALVGRIGLNGKVFLIGGTEGFVADSDGTLFLRNNDPDGLLWDNKGQIDVAIQRYGGGAGEATTADSSGLKQTTGQTLKAANSYGSSGDTAAGAPRLKPSGYYSAEQDITFNVLENVSFDPIRGDLTIAGRFDPNYAGPRIPYLQHLAVFLEYSAPQVSLDWTPEFERKIDSFFRRMDSETEMANLIGSGQLMDSSGRITEKGRLFLPLFGVKAYNHGNAAGALGVDTRMKELGVVEITRVFSGTAADRAGLRIGDEIYMINLPDGIAVQPYAPNTLYRTIRFAGAGAEVMFNINGFGPDSEVYATLDAYQGDSWEHVNKYDINSRIFSLGGYQDIADVLVDLDRMIRLLDTDAGLQMMWLLLYTLDIADWAEQARQQVMNGQMAESAFMYELSRRMAEGMERKMGLASGTMVNPYSRSYAQTGDSWDALDVAILDMNRALEPLLKESLRTALYQNDQITMPVAVLDPNANFSPTVTPRYINVPSDSELARLFVEADYVGKAIIHKPELSNTIPAYQTEYAFIGDRPGAVTETTSRLWTEPARIEVYRTDDNATLRFGQVDMQFNIGRAIGGSVERRDDAYSRFLTSLYDDLSKEFYQLHELREAAKIMMAARWIKSQAPNFTLPSKGRVRLTSPSTLEGFVTLIWSPHRVKVSLIAPGGIDFNVPPIGPSGPVFPDQERVNIPIDSSVVDFSDRASSDLPAIDPAVFAPQATSSIPVQYRRPLTMPPVPSSIRLVGLATKGQRTLDRLSALNTKTQSNPARCDAEQSRMLRDKLNFAMRTAQQLNGVDRALNAITAQLPERMRTIEEINKIMHEEPRRIRDAAIDLWTGGVLNMYDELEGSVQMRSIQDFETLIAHMKQAKEKLEGISSTISNLDLALSSAMARSLNEREQATGNLLEYLKGTIGDASKLKGNDAVTRAFRAAGKTTKAADAITAVMEVNSSTYKLLNALDSLERLDAQSEQEVAALRKTLLPMQGELSNRLDAAMNDPLIKSLETGTGKLDCGTLSS